ncbi:SDR family NAD(P)-dependent oxidoreductase, partial [Actinoplanes sp. NPDC048967]|uniref:SDR family NAD(P)-dependent oxidoreductase n=1 Tax=Actinoplanes sp. NPDC048967 TaxID=3155269 RepID=UPI0033EDEFD9
MLRTELIRPLSETLRAHADRYADKVAFSDARQSVTYGELELRTRRLAGHLAALRLQPGDRAAILMGNCVEAVESYLAITRASAVGVPLNPRLTADEIAYLLDDSGVRVVIADPARAELISELLPKRPHIRLVVTGSAAVPARATAYATLVTTDPAVPARDDLGLDDVAWMLYTSGTTGRPKGVLSTQRSCLWSVAACYVPIPGLSDQDRVVWPLPLFHSLAHIACVLAVTSVGASARIVDGISAAEVLDAIRETSATFLAGVPTMYHYLVEAARESGFDAPDLRVCLVGGAITTAALRRSFEEAFGAPLIDAYGSTETCGSITINWPTGARVEGSCGLPVPGLGVRLVDPETLIDVPAGTEGEVWVRGTSVMLGYHGQPDATAAAFHDGWYRTGDLARRDDAGYFTITGRIKELIIRGGENIHPAEIEEAIRAVSGVADVAVAGRPHDILGEVPVAFIVAGREGFDPDAVYATCRARLAYFKVPEELYEIAEIPRTASGKVTRHVLLTRPTRLRATAGGHYENLFRLDWIPLPSAPVPAAEDTGGWAYAGDAGSAPATLARRYPDLTALEAAVAGGEPAPEVVALALPDATGDPIAAARAAHARLAALEVSGARILLLTRHGVTVGDSEEPAAGPAAVWALARGLQAAGEERFFVADVDAVDEATTDALRGALAAGEPQVAVRGGVALAPRLVRVATSSTATAAPGTVDPSRTVVVTGADSPVAAATAHRLVAHGARRLLLISLRGDADAPAAALREELAALGVKVRLVACDVADREALAAALAAGKRPIGVVVHAPGRPGTDDALAAFVTGASELAGLAPADPAAELVVLAPAADLIGGDPAVAVAGALAGVAVRRHRARWRRTLALSFGPWAGSATPTAGASWIGELAAPDAMAMLDAARTMGDSALVALRIASVAPRGTRVPAVLRRLIDAPAPAVTLPGDSGLRDRLDGLDQDGQVRVLVDLVCREAAELTGLPGAVPAERAFKDLGFTSVTAVELRNRLVAATGLRLPATIAFDYPTPAAVARFLRSEVYGGTALPIPAAGPGVSEEPVAIVAMACRLPGGVVSPEGLWDVVSGG